MADQALRHAALNLSGRPLFGHTIVVTCVDGAPKSIIEPFKLPLPKLLPDEPLRALAYAGARVVVVRCVSIIHRPISAKNVLAAQNTLGPLEKVAAVGLASKHAITGLIRLLAAAKVTLDPRCVVVAVGPQTARLAEEALGRRVQVATPHTAEGLAAHVLAHLEKTPKTDARPTDGALSVLLPSAAQGRVVAADVLMARGFRVLRLPVYDAVPQLGPKVVHLGLPPSFVWVTSPSCLLGLKSRFEEALGARIIALGPATTQAVHNVGLSPYAEAMPHTLWGMLYKTVCVQQKRA